MEVFHGIAALTRQLRAPAVTIGNFDGVHLGHRRLMELAQAGARRRGGESVVLTFDPHPAQVLAPALAPPLICSVERRLELIAEAGIDVCVVEPFTVELASHTPGAFVDEVLVRALSVAEVVVGYDFTYGRKRAGNVQTLVAAGQRQDFEVTVVAPVNVDGMIPSSTKIREFVHEGKLGGASALLGRPFELEGPVVEGAHRGKQIGVPTANIATTNEVLPPKGVYAAHVVILDEPGRPLRPAAVNLGTNPTFTANGQPLSLEAHILDYDGDLYGRRLRVLFHSRIRGEARFASVDALVARIREDIAETRRRLAAG